MRRILTLLPLVMTTAGCGSNGEPRPVDVQSSVQATAERLDEQQSTRATAEPVPKREATPRLWLDEDAARMIRSLLDDFEAGDWVEVIRWENSELHGCARLESEEDGTPLSYDLSVTPDRPAGGPLASGGNIVSGMLVVIMRTLPEAEGEAYDVRIEQQFTRRKGNEWETLGQKTRRGTLLRMPPGGHPIFSASLVSFSRNRCKLEKWENGQSAAWLWVQLGSDPPDVFNLVPVSGQVTLDGQPLGDTHISFSYAGCEREAAAATTDAEGRYTLRAEAGWHRVRIGTAVTEDVPHEAIPGPADKLPARYRDGTLTFEVEFKGTTAADFHLSSQ